MLARVRHHWPDPHLAPGAGRLGTGLKTCKDIDIVIGRHARVASAAGAADARLRVCHRRQFRRRPVYTSVRRCRTMSRTLSFSPQYRAMCQRWLQHLRVGQHEPHEQRRSSRAVGVAAAHMILISFDTALGRLV